MPIYEYRCRSCDHLMEVFAKMSDPPPLACESCGGTELERVLHPVAVHYKGSGFYATDYGSSRKTGRQGETPATAADKPASSDGAAKSSGDARPSASPDSAAPAAKPSPSTD